MVCIFTCIRIHVFTYIWSSRSRIENQNRENVNWTNWGYSRPEAQSPTEKLQSVYGGEDEM